MKLSSKNSRRAKSWMADRLPWKHEAIHGVEHVSWCETERIGTILLTGPRRDDGDFHGVVDFGFWHAELPVDGDTHGIIRERALPLAAACSQPGEQRSYIGDGRRQCHFLGGRAEFVHQGREIKNCCHEIHPSTVVYAAFGCSPTAAILSGGPSNYVMIWPLYQMEHRDFP